MHPVPEIRVRRANTRAPRPDGAFVLYWMVANRRPHHNYSLDHALAWAQELGRPLLVLETLRCDYGWASRRIHTFMVQGMAAHVEHFAAKGVTYYPYVEPEPGRAQALLDALAAQACVVVSDDYPCFCLPAMVAAAGKSCPVRLDLVDSNGLLPLRAFDRTFPTAYAFRRALQKRLPDFLLEAPRAQPLRAGHEAGGAEVPAAIARRFPRAAKAMLAAEASALAPLPIDHAVGAATAAGGFAAADALAHDFVAHRLARFDEARNHPDLGGGSSMSPYLHFGALSMHAVFGAIARAEKWDIGRLAETSRGAREGWWGMSPAAEAFLDEAVTWRELGYNRSALDPDGYDKYESLPEWAQKTLAEHARDPRPHTYTQAQLEAAETDDPVWNAAQREIVREGRMNNYLRMLWGKNVLAWSKTPQQAAATLIELNNKYGLDGRDPNSYSGIFWVFGRYDRPWPERPIFGKIRYMSSASTQRKLKMKRYLEKFAA